MSNKEIKKQNRKETIRYEKNPFLKDFEVQTGKKNVRVSALGKDDNILVNQTTGEVHGTHVATYRKVDQEKFVKLFCQNIALTFELTAAGIKAFNVLIVQVQKSFNSSDKDKITLDKWTLAEFLEDNPNIKAFSESTFHRGIGELEKAKIIAKTMKKGDYYINPQFVFCGDRIAFTTLIERENKEVKQKKEEK